MSRVGTCSLILLLALALCPVASEASHISGIRITQTGNTGLTINVDVTAFYTTGSTNPEAYLGTYYNAVPAIDWGDGSTVPRYGYGPSTGIPLAATSTVVNGIPTRSYRGSFSHTYGGAGNFTISAQTRCCPLTTPTYTLVTGSIITTTVTTTGVFGPTTFTTSFVQNTLDVTAAAPGFDKAFAPTTIAAGSTSTLTYTIDNSASTLDDNVLDFTDNLPVGLQVANPANAMNTCTGGTLTAVPGMAVVNYTGGLVAAGATCTISVDIEGVAAGMFTSTSGDLTSAFGNSGTASDTLTVTGTPPTFSVSFADMVVAPGETTELIAAIDNTMNIVPATGLAFNSTLPTGLAVTALPIRGPGTSSTTCGGTVTAVGGTMMIDFSGGTVGAGATCEVRVGIEVLSEGPFDVEVSPLATSLGDADGGGGGVGGGPVVTLSTTFAIDIPTLSEMGVAILVGLLALFAFGLIRRQH